jgi:hypothetical protein
MPQRHRPELSDSVSADPLGRYRRTPHTFGPGRTCAGSGCLTVLSIYNSSKHCAAHSPNHLRVTPAPSPTDTITAPPYALAADHPQETGRSPVGVVVDREAGVRRQAS